MGCKKLKQFSFSVIIIYLFGGPFAVIARGPFLGPIFAVKKEKKDYVLHSANHKKKLGGP